MTPEQQEILRRKNSLNRKMVKLRQELNNEHYYPELDKIQQDCPHTQNVNEQRCVVSMFCINYYCGYCEKLLSTKEGGYVNDFDT